MAGDGPACDGRKKVYRRWKHARNDATAVERKESGKRGRVEAYWCCRCRGYHVGHRRDRRERRTA